MCLELSFHEGLYQVHTASLREIYSNFFEFDMNKH